MPSRPLADPSGLPLEQVSVWGDPFHGELYQASNGGTYIKLPNNTERSYPLPEMAGITHRVKVPGVKPINRTPAELAADQAAGMQWRNEAILSGRAFQLYQKELGGWIYCAPDGSRWLIKLDTRGKSATAHRFGEFGLPADDRTVTVNWPSDVGQSTPAISGSLVQTSRDVQSISSDGRQAIIRLWLWQNTPVDGEVETPIGFLRAVVTGGKTQPFVINVTVEASRAEVLGSTSYVPGITVYPRNPPESDTEWGSGTDFVYLTNRIVAIWFSKADQIVKCTLDIEQSRVVDVQPRWFQPFLYEDKFTYRLKVAGQEVCTAWHAIEYLYHAPEGTTVSRITARTSGGHSQQFDGTDGRGDSVPRLENMPPEQYRLWPTYDIAVMYPSNNALLLCTSMPYADGTRGFYRAGVATPTDNPVQTPAFTFRGPTINQPIWLLYGPQRFYSFNPITDEIAGPSDRPVGWA